MQGPRWAPGIGPGASLGSARRGRARGVAAGGWRRGRGRAARGAAPPRGGCRRCRGAEGAPGGAGPGEAGFEHRLLQARCAPAGHCQEKATPRCAGARAGARGVARGHCAGPCAAPPPDGPARVILPRSRGGPAKTSEIAASTGAGKRDPARAGASQRARHDPGGPCGPCGPCRPSAGASSVMSRAEPARTLGQAARPGASAPLARRLRSG
jgi:hypothetical protein